MDELWDAFEYSCFYQALNYEKIFFTDKVILVLGPVDNLIYHSILRRFVAQMYNKAEIIEIFEVTAIYELNKLSELLDRWQIKFYIIADKDYISEHKENLFVLTLGNIEAYFPSVGKSLFHIDDALMIAKDIENGTIAVPDELERIFKNIVSESH